MLRVRVRNEERLGQVDRLGTGFDDERRDAVAQGVAEQGFGIDAGLRYSEVISIDGKIYSNWPLSFNHDTRQPVYSLYIHILYTDLSRFHAVEAFYLEPLPQEPRCRVHSLPVRALAAGPALAAGKSLP